MTNISSLFGLGSGSSVSVDTFVAGVDFTAGTSTQLTLSRSPASKNSVLPAFDGVLQFTTEFSILTNVVTFSSPIPVETTNVQIIHFHAVDQGTVADGAITYAKMDLNDDDIPLAKVATAAKDGANTDITSMTGLDDGGIPLAKVLGASAGSAGDYGLVPSNDTDTEHDIAISVGQIFDSTRTTNLILPAIMTKQIDATWAAGDDAGGLFSGSVAADTWYAMFLIEKDSDSSIDIGFDTSIIAANIPAGYTKYRRIGWVLTDGSANIEQFDANEISGGGLRVDWKEFYTDFAAAVPTSRTLITFTAPPWSIVEGIEKIQDTAQCYTWLKSTSFTDADPIGATRSDIFCFHDTVRPQVWFHLTTDANSQLAFRGSSTIPGVIVTFAYTDGRI